MNHGTMRLVEGLHEEKCDFAFPQLALLR
jgi:hypothetical protein